MKKLTGWVLTWGWPKHEKPVGSFSAGMKAWGDLTGSDHWGAALVWHGPGDPPDYNETVDVFKCDAYLEQRRREREKKSSPNGET